jgi:DNA (cytosine-5)-methyltransferase 1
MFKIYNKPIRVGTVNKGGQGDRIYDPFGQAITLSAEGGGTGAKTGLYYINNEVRKLHPRECARLMGFPEDYQIDDSVNQAQKQFGNSVVVNVLQYIVKSIIDEGSISDG